MISFYVKDGYVKQFGWFVSWAAKIFPVVKNQHLLLCTLLIGNSLAMEVIEALKWLSDDLTIFRKFEVWVLRFCYFGLCSLFPYSWTSLCLRGLQFYCQWHWSSCSARLFVFKTNWIGCLLDEAYSDYNFL